MAKESMSQLRNRLRQQAAQAHATEPEVVDERLGEAHAELEAVERTMTDALARAEAAEPPHSVSRPGGTASRRRRSPWVNPYPAAMPFQTSVYLTNDDLELIKELRLKLHFAREWMVLKYALEKLKGELEKASKGGKHGNNETAA